MTGIMTQQLGSLKVNAAPVATGTAPAAWQATGLGLADRYAAAGESMSLDLSSAVNAITSLWSTAALITRPGIKIRASAAEKAQSIAVRAYSTGEGSVEATQRPFEDGAALYTLSKTVLDCTSARTATLSIYATAGNQFSPTTYTPYLEESDSDFPRMIESALRRQGGLENHVIAKACKIYDIHGKDTNQLLVVTFPENGQGVAQVWFGAVNGLQQLDYIANEMPQPADFIGSMEFDLPGVGGLSINGSREVSFTPQGEAPMLLVPLV